MDFVDYFSAGEAFYVAANSKLKLNGLKSTLRSFGLRRAWDDRSVRRGVPGEEVPCRRQHVPDPERGERRRLLGPCADRLRGLAGRGVHRRPVQGAFKLSGKAFETAPYGIALPKNGLAKPVLGAVKELISDGIYLKILDKWGVESGAISKPVINGATS